MHTKFQQILTLIVTSVICTKTVKRDMQISTEDDE